MINHKKIFIQNKINEQELAFTLIELLIVVAIISILSFMGVVNYKMSIDRAEAARCASNLKVIGTALNSYFVDYNKYPYADGNAEVRNSHNLPSNFGKGPAANGYWDSVPFLIVDLGYITDESVLYCPKLVKRNSGRKKYLRYAYNRATAVDEALRRGNPIAFLDFNHSKIWLARCLYRNNYDIPSHYIPYPHGEEDDMENALYTDGKVDLVKGGK